MVRIFLLMLVACAGDPGDVLPDLHEFDPCDAQCPDGTEKAKYTDVEIVLSDAFYVLDGECESVCEPISPCIWPNVPAISAAGYSCVPLPGYNDFPAPSEVPFGWASVPVVPDPWLIDSGFEVVPDWILSGYLDGDAYVDVVVASGTWVETHLGNGAGGFAAQASDLGVWVERGALADVDGDGIDDLVARVDTGTLQLVSFRSDGGGGFEASVLHQDLGTAGTGPSVADIDGDGALDVVMGGQGGLDGMYVGWDFAGAAQWTQLASTSCGGCIGEPYLGDIDGNGQLDVWNEDSWWFGSPGQIFAEKNALLVGFQPGFGSLDWSLELADVTGDGLADLISGSFGIDAYDSAPMVIAGDGTGLYLSGDMVHSWCTAPVELSVGDVDGDGLSELVTGAADCDEIVISYPPRFDTDLVPGAETLGLVNSTASGAPLVADFDGTGIDRIVTVIP